MQDIYLDANFWNLVFDNKIDLIHEFPKSKFRLLQTREAEFENNAVPEGKSDLKEFIQKEIERCEVQTIRIFGFEDSSTPDNERRFGGFEKNSVWITSKEKDFRDEQKERIGKPRKSKLYNNEADIAIASKSFESIVLTFDLKKGPLKNAKAKRGKIIDLKGFDNSKVSLHDFIYGKDS